MRTLMPDCVLGLAEAVAAKTKLPRLQADPPKVTRLVRAVESKPGIMRMVTIRRIQPLKNMGVDMVENLRKTQ